MGQTVTIGNFACQEFKDNLPHIKLSFPSKDFRTDWRRYNLVSNYIAEYSSYYFDQKDRAENLISSILYELVEYIVLFTQKDSEIIISFHLCNNQILFELISKTEEKDIKMFIELMEDLNNKDVSSYYFDLLESNLDEPVKNRNFGIVMVAHDYNALFSARIESEKKVTTLRVIIRQEEIYS